ncbi:hypothetical protein J2Y46_003895 [Microbacterium sp. BE35]|nr:hypothetical protein [Microbacterium sp. BE35]
MRPSPVDLRTSVAYDVLALEAATGYEALRRRRHHGGE